jgi:hypothetical protein
MPSIRTYLNLLFNLSSGLTIDSAGGRYWDQSKQYDAPWKPVSGKFYNTDEKGNADGFFYLSSGFNYKENIGRAVVFRRQDGDRVACGIFGRGRRNACMLNNRPKIA